MKKTDNKIAIIEKEISEVKLNSLKIKDEKSLYLSVEWLSKCNKMLDNVIEQKKKLTDPLNQALKEVRLRYKPIETRLELMIIDIKAKQSSYQQKALETQKLHEIDITNRLLGGNLILEQAVAKLDSVKTPNKVSTNDGKVSFIPIKRFEVMDIILLSEVNRGQYILPNEPLIREAMKQGIELAGVRYYEELSVRNNR